jgi:deoxyribodipyrimidine photolyase-like uncharacterized protein
MIHVFETYRLNQIKRVLVFLDQDVCNWVNRSYVHRYINTFGFVLCWQARASQIYHSLRVSFTVNGRLLEPVSIAQAVD